MPYKNKYKFEEIERREGKPMAEILASLYDLYGDQPQTQTKVAESLGVTQGTVSSWASDLGLRFKTVVVLPA